MVLHVGDGHLRPTFRKEAGHRDPGAGQTDYQYFLVLKFHKPIILQLREVRKIRTRIGESAIRPHSRLRELRVRVIYRSFNVEIATSASMIVMIQNRTMIFGSATPFSSKWWWMGAMRKIRFPRYL